jgi:Skp family chaperone for outer membrane proteins
MRKHFLILFLTFNLVNAIHSQTRGTKLGYIDMEYILENVPNYTAANINLEQKAQKWKLEIASKAVEINKLKDALDAEKPLLTEGLIEERESEIKFLSNEMIEFQQKRFGPGGDLMIQKSVLVKPIQDQVFTAIQDIAEAKKYDFIFDKSSDLTMMFAAKRFDISDQVLRIINRVEKREQLSKKELAAEEAKEKKEDAIDDNPLLAERQKILEVKRAQRDSLIVNRKLLQEEKKAEFNERRQKMLFDREAKNNGTVSDSSKTDDKKEKTSTANNDRDPAKLASEETKNKQLDLRAQAIEDRKKVIEDRKKVIEEKRVQALQKRDSIKRAREEQIKQKQ